MRPPITLRLPAPAKVNLFLHVTGKRDDGYHTLETLLVPIDHGDHVTLSERDDTAVVRARGAVEVAAGDDIAVRAARLVQRNCGIRVASASTSTSEFGGRGARRRQLGAATVLLGLNRACGSSGFRGARS